MLYIVSITSQGQISIPAPLRKKMGLDKSQKALVSEKGGKLMIEPIRDLLELRGTFKTNVLATPSQIRRAFEEHGASRKSQ